MDSLRFSHAAAALLGVIILSTLAVSTSKPLLKTSTGRVRGFQEKVNRKPVEVFYGIPYAAPPVGDLRFQPPVAAPSWTKPRDGTVKPAACWQLQDAEYYEAYEGLGMWEPSTGVSEDCLYLNVWRPKRRSGPKKIMVWIHGGFFWTGSAVPNDYGGSEMAVREDVILVTIAYRLGVPGFLITSDETTGNMGLFDQRLALEWVRENAVNLGGSQDDITIFGEDAGAASAGFQLMTKDNNLFTNVIMQSGSPLCPWATMNRKTAISRSKKAAKNLGCKLGDDQSEYAACVNALSVEDLTKQLFEMDLDVFELPLRPVVDGSIVVTSPTKAFDSDGIYITDVLIGVDKNEGILPGYHTFHDIISRDGTIEDTQDFEDMVLQIANNDKDFQKSILKKYNRLYTGENYTLEIWDNAIGDYLIKCCVLDFARKYTKQTGTVYLYSFEDRYSFNPWPEWVSVPHGSEIEVLLGSPLEKNSGTTDDERDRIEEVMGRWSSFAKTGVPSGNDVIWPIFTLENEDYVRFENTGLVIDYDFRNFTCGMWNWRGTGNGWIPEKPTPEPEKPTPEPEKPTPEPEKPTPEPEKPTPEPEKPTPPCQRPTPPCQRPPFQRPTPPCQRPPCQRPTPPCQRPPCHRPGPIFNRPGPIFNRPGPIFNRPGPIFTRPIFNRPTPPCQRPPCQRPTPQCQRPPCHRPGPILIRPGPIFHRPGPIFNRPGPIFNRPGPIFHRPGPVPQRPGSSCGGCHGSSPGRRPGFFHG